LGQHESNLISLFLSVTADITHMRHQRVSFITLWVPVYRQSDWRVVWL